MAKLRLLTFAFSIFFACLLSGVAEATAQQLWDGCPMEGDNPRKYEVDLLKNRYVIPQKYEYIEFGKMAAMRYDDRASQNKAVKLKGYVIIVKFGGPETCNCHTRKPDDYDIHLVLTNNENDMDPKNGIVVELTPRVRDQLNRNWDRNKVKKLFYHKWVTVSGYLFDDTEHKSMSAADDAHPKNIHRATCWEVHPVTDIQLAK